MSEISKPVKETAYPKSQSDVAPPMSAGGRTGPGSLCHIHQITPATARTPQTMEIM